MGVQGLATLLETHRQIYRDVQFRASRLVIDGCNLMYLLYFHSGLDQNRGGEYAAFEDLIERFFKALRDCRVEAYVVLDGGSDPTDKKLETLMQRALDKITKAHQAAEDGGHKNIFPQLARLVFRQTLARLEVPVAQCYAESDQQIAALANEWQCPVLSNDSDFYIFDVQWGLLPISHFRWQEVKLSGPKSYIPCKKYNTSSFCTLFNIQRKLLPTFAVLRGNDYVKLQRMNVSISWAQFSPAGNGTLSHLVGLLCWLRRYQCPSEALEAAVGLMRDLSRTQRSDVLQGLYLGMEEYQIPPCSLGRFFSHGTPPPFPAVGELADLVPDWLLLPLTQARLTANILDVLLLQRMSLSFPVEHANMPSSHLTSRPLRQVMYGLLLGRGKPVQVKERDREGLQVKVVLVHPAYRGVSQQLHLGSLDKVELSVRLQLLLEALGVTEALLSRLPPPLCLLVATTCYWLQRAQPPVDLRLLKALLLGLSNREALTCRAGSDTQDDSLQQTLDLDAAHALNQWQSCLKASIHLNQLLGFPLPEPRVAWVYEGTLVHLLVHRMKTKTLRSLLRFNRSSVRLYKTLLGAVHQFQAQRTAAAPRRPLRRVDNLTADLQLLFLHDKDGEEAPTGGGGRAAEDHVLEEHLDYPVQMRTRYTAKERNNRGNNPDLIRKEERRGLDLI